MKVFIGADHRGYIMGNKLKNALAQKGHVVEFVGTEDHTSNDDYVDFAAEVGRKVAASEEGRGVVLCGSGVGVDIAANKIKGIRAALGYSSEQVVSARNDDDINVLALGADFLDEEKAETLVEAFLQTPFDRSERRVRRIGKIAKLEE